MIPGSILTSAAGVVVYAATFPSGRCSVFLGRPLKMALDRGVACHAATKSSLISKEDTVVRGRCWVLNTLAR